MNDIAIHVENLSKLYRIGAKQESYRTLRDTITIESNISNATGRHTADTLIDGHFAMVQDCITFAEINNTFTAPFRRLKNSPSAIPGP